MTRMSSENIASDQNGYASMTSSWTMALIAAIATPSQRTPLTRIQTPSAVNPCTTETQMRTQPHVLSPLRTYFALLVKKVEFETAAMPSIKLSVASIARMTPANSTQPSPRASSAYSYAYAGSFEAAVSLGSTVLMNPSWGAWPSPQFGDPGADGTPAYDAPHHLNCMISGRPFTRFG